MALRFVAGGTLARQRRAPDGAPAAQGRRVDATMLPWAYHRDPAGGHTRLEAISNLLQGAHASRRGAALAEWRRCAASLEDTRHELDHAARALERRVDHSQRYSNDGVRALAAARAVRACR
jgi:hypothetical protein